MINAMTVVMDLKKLQVGLRCVLGTGGFSYAPAGVDAAQMKAAADKTISDICDTLIMVYPNAGLPNELGEYDEQPSTTAGLVREWAANAQVNVLGGCCGSTPAHIAAIAKAVGGLTPRALPVPPVVTRLAGLEPMTMAA